MKIKCFIWVLHNVLDFLATLYHELWHWIPSFIFFYFGYCDFPELNLTRVPKIEFVEDNTSTVNYSCSMSVSYSYDRDTMKKWMHNIILAGPAFGFFLIFLVSPWWLCIFAVVYADTIWLSSDDLKKLGHPL